jgi:hypothetical protein
MATTSNELKILVTLVDQTKGSSAAILKSLADIKNGVDALGADNAKGTTALSNEIKKVGEHAKATSEHVKGLTGGIHGLIERMNHLAEGIKLVTGGFLAWEAIQMVKEIADVAARSNTLAVAMNVVGQNAGYTTAELSKTDKAVQELGITAEASRQSITQLIQSGLALSFARPLARASQDLAVITGQNSSQTFQRLVANIQQMDTLGLRFMGIMIDRERVMAQAARETGTSISGTLEKVVFANAVLAEAAKLTGLYEAAMQSAGKALTSMPRYIENFKDALGQDLQPVYLQLIIGTQAVLKALTHLLESFHEAAPNAELFGESAADAAGKLTPLARAVRDFADALAGAIHWLQDHKAILSALGSIIGFVTKAVIALGLAWGLVTGGGAALGVLRGLPALFLDIKKAIAAVVLASSLGTPVITALGAAFRTLLGPVGLIITLASVLMGVWEVYARTSEKTSGIAKQSVKEQVEGYKQALKDQERLVEENNKAQDRLRIARNKREAATPSDRKQAQENVVVLEKEAKASADALGEQNKKIAEYEDILKNSKELSQLKDLQEEVKKVRDAHADRIKTLLAEVEAQKNLAQSLQKAGGDYNRYLSGISLKTQEVVGTIRLGIEQLGHAAESNISTGIQENVQLFQQQAARITTPEELELLAKRAKELNADVAKFGIDISKQTERALEIAKINVETAQFELANGGAAYLREQTNVARRTAQLDSENARITADRHKLENDRLEAIDTAFFQRGLRNLDEYYQKKIEYARENADDQLKVQLANIAELEKKAALTADTATRTFTEKQIAQAKERAYQIIGRAQIDQLNAIIKRETDRLNLEIEIQRVAAAINKETGNGRIAIEQEITLAREQELIKARQLTGVERENAIALVNRKYALEEQKQQQDERLAQLGRELNLTRALLDLDESIINAKLQRGDITSLQADEKKNEVIRERVASLQKEYDETLRNRNLAISEQRFNAARELNTEAARLQKQIVDLIASFKTVADKLQETLTGSIASNLEAIINRTKSFKQGFLDIFKDLNTQIIKIITRDWAEGIVRVLKDNNALGKLGEIVLGKKEAAKPTTTASKGDIKQDSEIPKASPEVAQAKVDFAAFARVIEEAKETTKHSLDDLRSGFDEAAKAAYALAQALKLPNIPQVSPVYRPGTGIGEVGGPEPKTPDERATVTIKKLMALGLPFDQAVGVTANLIRESTFQGITLNPQAIGDNGTAFGLAQWRGSRLEDLKKFSGTDDLKQITFDQQLQFIVAELKAKEAHAKTILDQAKSPEEAAVSTSSYYERPANKAEEAAIRSKIATQLAAKNADLNGKEQTAGTTPANPVYVKNVEETAGVTKSSDKEPVIRTSADIRAGRTGGEDAPPVGTAAYVRSGRQSIATASSDEKKVDGKPIEDALTAAAKVAEPHVTSAIVQGVEKAEGPFAGLLTKFLLMAISSASASSGASSGSSGWLGSLLNFFKGGSSNTGFGTGSQYGNQDYGLNFAEGGLVSGPGTGTSDSIAAHLSDGEYVMTAEKTARFLPMLEAMRSGSLDNLFSNLFGSLAIHVPRTPHFASGGLVDTAVMNQPRAVPASPIVINVYTPDANSFRKSKAQIMAELGVATATSVRRNR